MKITSTGIYLHKTELRVLLAFAESKKDSHLAVVHFEADAERIYARSTDGHRAIQATGLVEDGDAAQGEWAVSTLYLEDCFKLLTPDDYLVLKVSGGSLHTSAIFDIETLEERTSVESAHDAAQIQTTFPITSMNTAITLPTNSKRPRCATVKAKYLSELKLLGPAAHEGVDVYFGKESKDGIWFTTDSLDTTWLGRIMGMQESTSETDDGQDNRQEAFAE